MTLNNVLLPEPFGPITPTISWLSTERSTPSSARTPRNLSDTFSTRSSTLSAPSTSRIQPGGPAFHTRPQRQNSLREEHHPEQQDHAIGDHAVFTERPEIFGGRFEHRGGD